MGSSLSPEIENIFIHEFKLKVLQIATHPPKFWGRYIDDTGTINKEIHVQVLFTHINSQYQSMIVLQ